MQLPEENKKRKFRYRENKELSERTGLSDRILRDIKAGTHQKHLYRFRTIFYYTVHQGGSLEDVIDRMKEIYPETAGQLDAIIDNRTNYYPYIQGSDSHAPTLPGFVKERASFSLNEIIDTAAKSRNEKRSAIIREIAAHYNKADSSIRQALIGCNDWRIVDGVMQKPRSEISWPLIVAFAYVAQLSYQDFKHLLFCCFPDLGLALTVCSRDDLIAGPRETNYTLSDYVTRCKSACANNMGVRTCKNCDIQKVCKVPDISLVAHFKTETKQTPGNS